MTLSLLVTQDRWQEFDDAWTEQIGSGAPIDEVLAALRVAAEKKRLPRCVPLIRLHVERLAADDRHADAARLLGQAVVTGAAAGELTPLLVENARAAWGKETWFERYSELSGLKEGAPDARKSWLAFERLLVFAPHKLVFHPGGWGAGEVTELDHETSEMHVRFSGGRTDRFPLAAAIEIFESLPEGDLRAIHFRDGDAIKRLVREDPLSLLKAVVQRYNGRASTTAIKNALLQVGVEGGSYSAWWRKTRKLAENSEWFRVTGTPAKGDVLLLRTAMDPVGDLRRQLEAFQSLQDLLTRVKNQLDSKPEEPLRTMMLDVLEARTAASTEPITVRFNAWMLLRDHRGTTPPEALDALRDAAAQPTTPGRTPPLWALIQSLTTTRDQEKSVQVLQEVLGDLWPEDALANLGQAPGGMVRPLVDALAAAGKKQELAGIYRELLGRPLRSPDALVAVARLGEAGKLPGVLPPALQRAQALLSLATNLYVNRNAATGNVRAQTKLTELLTKGKEPLLFSLLANADHDALESLQRNLQRGVDEEIEHVVAEVATRVAPLGMRDGGSGFWNNDSIWTTKKGLDKRRGELRHLREVKIPANTDAIGRAAAMGDLSENAEWEAAIEEQRNLTSRAAEMETELRKVELIENAILPDGVVCPGSTVRYKESKNGKTHEIAILGPWDTDGNDHVVSYRAPLAAGLLGKSAGEKVTITLPSGTLDVEVVETTPMNFDN